MNGGARFLTIQPSAKRPIRRVRQGFRQVFVQLALLATTAGILSQPPILGLALASSPPLIFYSDLDNGPNAGGENNGGVYVTVYGNNFGPSQGSSLISIGNTAAVTYKLWSNTKVAFQVPAAAAAGTQPLSITVNGIQSNAVPFTIRTSGTIYCVSTSGNDAGPGTFAGGCWKTVQHAVDKMMAGDTTYVRQGVVEASPNNEGSVQIGLNAWNNGTAGNPIALGGYPGEIATIGANGSGICNQDQSQCYEGLHAVGGINQNYSYWTIFNLTLRGQQFGLEVDGFGLSAVNPASTNWRVVGNDFSCPWMNGASGPYCATFSQTNYVWFYGNNVHDVQTYPYSQVPGPEWNGGVYFTTDSNHIWCAWNTVTNVQGARGIQFHSSPLGNGGAGDPTGHNQYDLHVHDNLVHDIAMDGILFATVDPSQGPVEAYNNIVYNAGKGPQHDGSGYYSGIYVMGLTNSGSVGSGDVEVYNNTLYNDGAWTKKLGLGWGAALAANAPQNGSPNLRMHARNNIVYQPTAGEFYWTISNPSSECSATCGNLYGSNNLFYGLGAPIANRNFSSGLSADPQFVNLAGFDFHLTLNSPARGAGVDTGLLTDIDGTTRPHSVPFDLGAYAFIQASSLTVALSASPDSLSFNAAGGSAPGVQSLTIMTSGGSVPVQFSASAAWISVSPTSSVTPATAMVAVNPAGLGPGSHTAAIYVSATGATNSPLTISVTLVVSRLLPVVTGVVNTASMASGVQSNSWATIWGTNLSFSTRLWQSADVVDGKLPVSLEGVSVLVNGKGAAISYVSPTQINTLTPVDTTTGPVSFVVINDSGSSASFPASLQTYAPGFSMFDARYPAAIIPTSSTTFDYLGPAGRFLPAFASRPAKPGEVVEFFGTGFGPTTPPAPSLQWFTSNFFRTDPVAITIGGVPANVAWGGMSSPGLYQFNVTVPDLPDGDHKLVAIIGGMSAQDNVFVAVRR